MCDNIGSGCLSWGQGCSEVRVHMMWWALGQPLVLPWRVSGGVLIRLQSPGGLILVGALEGYFQMVRCSFRHMRESCYDPRGLQHTDASA